VNEENNTVTILFCLAPVKSVDITLKDHTVTCKTSGVYPKPQVSWSSGNEPVNTFQETEEKLFIVTSELKVGDNSGTHKYTCSITSKGRTKTSTLEKQGKFKDSGVT